MSPHRALGSKARTALKFIAVLALAAIAGTVGINLYILHCARGCVFHQVSDVPAQETLLVLGTDLLRFNGSTNVHFFNRVEGAADLFFSGKAKRLVISGNRDNKGFNEVDGMEKELLAKGIPKDAFILDYDGNSTWKSLQKAENVYHLQNIIIVTDSFHAPRAIYLAHHFGINAVVFCHDQESFGFWYMRYHAREWLARVKAFFEVMTDRISD